MFSTIVCTFSVACTISAISWYVFGGSVPDTVSNDIIWLLPIVVPSMHSPPLLIYTLALSPEELKERPAKIYILHSISQIFCALTVNLIASVAAWATVTVLFSWVEPLGKGGRGSNPIIWVVLFLEMISCIVLYIMALAFSWKPYIKRAARYSDRGWLLEFDIICVPFQNIKAQYPCHSEAEEGQTGRLLEEIPTETSKSMREGV